MGKIKVGILPASKLFLNDNPYNDTYIFINNYCKRINEAGAIPVGILLSDGKLDIESLEMCDAFLLAGGSRIEPSLLECVSYAVNRNKPLLGVCLGMQAIGIYSLIEERLSNDKTEVTSENIQKMFKKIKEDKVQFLNPIEGHYKSAIGRENYEENIHSISLDVDSKLYDIYKRKSLDVLSMHTFSLAKYGENVFVSAKSVNVIEAIEYKRDNLFVVGVQFHAEIEDSNAILFERLIKEAEKRA